MKNTVATFFMVIGLLASAQNDLRFDKLSIANGLSSTKVFMTLEDDLGFMWIATERGIDRYDGRTIKNYSLDRIDEIRRLNFVELFLAKDHIGRIWVLSNNGILQLYDPILDAFVYYDQLSSTPNGTIYVGDYLVDNKGRHFVASFNGVLHYDPETKESKLIDGVDGTISEITQSENFGFFFGGRNGVFQVDEQLKVIRNLNESGSRWPQGRVDALFVQESENRLWIGTNEHGLYYYNLIHDDLKKADGGIGQLNVPVRSIIPFTGNQLLIGCDGRGVIRWDALRMELISEYLYNADNPSSLSSNSVYDINLNSQGVIFICTYRGGLNIQNPYAQEFEQVKHQPAQSNSLANDIVLSIEQPAPGLISYGTDKGLSHFDKEKDNWNHISLDYDEIGIRSPVVLSQSTSIEGILWAAAFNYSLAKLNRNSAGQFKLASNLSDQFKDLKIKSLLAHSHGELFIGTTNQGLWSYQEGEEPVRYDIREPLALLEYSPTKLLIGNRDGISFLDLQYNELSKLNYDFIGDSLDGKVVVSLLQDQNQSIWLGTNDGGVYKIDPARNQFKNYSMENGLASNSIYALALDNNNAVWVSTSSGISRITQDEIQNFYTADGVISTDFNRNAALTDDEGLIYFGTNQGAIRFDPAKIRLAVNEKEIVLTEFYLNHQLIHGGADSPLINTINNTENISLDYRQNSFALGFISIDYVRSGVGTFQWKLEGFDDNWIDQNSIERANYTNLNPGTYVFRVRQVDPTGREVASERSLKIVISPPYWRTPAAFVIYLLIGIALIVGILYFNKLRIESRHAEDQLHFLMDMAHEIKTPLTLIKAPLTDLINNNKVDDEVKASLNVSLSSADKLHRQMLQFLDFRTISTRKDSLHIERFNLIDLLREKIFAFKVLADRKAISINFDAPFEEYYISNDEKVLDKVIGNLLSNAIKYTPENGMVTLELSTSEKHWTLLVKDTGIGIDKKDQKKIFKLFYRTQNARESGSTGSGVGLILAKDLAMTLGGDLSLVGSTKNGSTFKIQMPLLQVQNSMALQPESKQLVEDATESGDPDRIKILYAEDDVDLRNYEKGKLGQKFNVIAVENGQDALDILERELPDLVISDVNMPKVNGRQLCMNIKSNKLTSHIPVILLTGLGAKENIQQGLESGADDYIVKPFDTDLLVTKIENLLESRRVLKEKFVGRSDETVDWEAISSEHDQQFIQDVTRLVEENLSDSDLSVNYLCESVGMSRTTFYHKLKSILDLSPADFIRTIRLKEAKKQLLNPNLNISEVAYRTGFMDAKYFSTVFKKYYGISPSNYVSEKSKKV